MTSLLLWCIFIGAALYAIFYLKKDIDKKSCNKSEQCKSCQFNSGCFEKEKNNGHNNCD